MKNKSKIFSIFIYVCFLFFGCRNETQNSNNTFYVDYVCKNDTLLQVLNNATSGKVSYYNNERKLQIVSLNYITEDHPNTHFFKVSKELPVKPDLNTIKYEIRFNDSMINDSISYSFKKFIFLKNGWEKKSEMGIIKIFDYPSTFDKKLKVIKNNVASIVFKTIVIDTYDK